MKNLILAVLLLVSGKVWAATEISTAGTNLGIGTTSTKNALSLRSTLAVGSATYTNTNAPSNGAIIEGNVGIGTLAPGTALDVAGVLRISGNVDTALTSGECVQTTTNGVLTTTGTACGSGGSASAAGGTNAVQYNSGSSTFAGDETKFIFDGTNVGIGTSLPNTGGNANNSAGTGVPGNGARLTLVGVGTTLSTATVNIRNSTGQLRGTVLDSGIIGLASGNNSPIVYIDPNDNLKMRPVYNSSNQVTAINASVEQNGTGTPIGGFFGAYHFNTVASSAPGYGIYGQTSDLSATVAPTGNYYGVYGTNYLGGVLTRTNKSYGVFANDGTLAAGTIPYQHALGTSGWSVMSGNLGIGTNANTLYTLTAPPLGGLIVEGNVGIGSVTPGAKLDVQGVGRFSSTLTASNLSGTNTGDQTTVSGNAGTATALAANGANCGAGNYPLGVDASGAVEDCTAASGGSGTINSGTTNRSARYSAATTLDSSTKIFDDGTNVGIGTIAPRSAVELGVRIVNIVGSNVGIGSLVPGKTLDVQGTIRSSSGFFGSGANLTGITGLVSGLTTNYVPKASSATALSNSLIFDNGTNVGIGSTVPQQVLDVNGSVQAQSFIGTAIGSSYVTGNLGVGTTVPANQLSVNGGVGIGTANSTYLTTVAPAGGLIVEGNVGIGTSIASNGGLLVMNGNVGVGTWVPGRALDVVGNERVTGNIGIGTTAPNAALDINNGTFKISSAGTVTGVAGSSISPSFLSTGTSTKMLVAAANGQYASVTMSGDVINNNTGVFTIQDGAVDPTDTNFSTGGNIGIGTLAGAQLLTIKGNLGIGTTAGDVYLTTAAPNGGAIIYGNVGIGTVTPGAGLDVSTSIRSVQGAAVGVGACWCTTPPKVLGYCTGVIGTCSACNFNGSGC